MDNGRLTASLINGIGVMDGQLLSKNRSYVCEKSDG